MNPTAATIATNAADVTLNGSGSTFAAINNFSTNNGTFTVTGGRTFNMAAAFNNGRPARSTRQRRRDQLLPPARTTAPSIRSRAGRSTSTGTFRTMPARLCSGSGGFFTGGVQQFDGTLIGDIDLNLNGATPTFGSSFNGSVASLSMTAGVTTYAAGAKITVGAAD